MKYKAFTLSEVLISLVIIGVIAAITLPALMNNTNDNQYKSALKKNFSVLSQAFRLAYGYDYDDFRDWEYVHSTAFTQSVYEKLSRYLYVQKTCGRQSGCWSQSKAKNGKNATYATENGLYDENYTFVLNDGTSVALDVWNQSNTNNVAGVYDGLLITNANLVIAVDVNGVKKPNIVGKDVFLFVLTEKGIVPAGIDNNSLHCESRSVNYNWDCTAKILKE